MYLEPCQKYKIELIKKIVNGFQLLAIFGKNSTLDVWHSFQYASVLFDIAYLVLGRLCETELSSHCEKGYYKGDPSLGVCGPCTCDIEDNEDPVCDVDGTREPESSPGKCFCKVLPKF